MSISIEQVLADAKRLVERLRSHDTAADALIQQTTGLNKRIETMTEFQEEIEEMNNIARHRPRTALILGIQRENRQIRQLQEENAELVASLKQHQAALDLIMSSYREQITRIRSAHKSEQDLLEKHSHETQESSQYIQKILEMAAVMQRAATSDESYCFQMEEMVSKLEYENQGLRELLRITKSVAKSVVSGPSSPQSAQSDDSSSKEQTSILHNRTVILSSPTLGISNKVEIKSPDPEPQEGAVVISEKVQTSVEAQGDHSSKASRPNPVDEVDTREESGGSGGTRVGGGGTLDLMAQGGGSELRDEKQETATGATSDAESANKNNNHGSWSMGSSVGSSSSRTIVDSVDSKTSGPKTMEQKLTGDTRVDPTTNTTNPQTILSNTETLSDSGNPGEGDSSSEDFDTSSLSSQSSVGTLKEADTLSITSELSESGGDATEKFLEQNIINMDSTHL